MEFLLPGIVWITPLMASLEKIPMSEQLITLLYICRILLTLQLKAVIWKSTVIARIAEPIAMITTTAAVIMDVIGTVECFTMFNISRVSYNVLGSHPMISDHIGDHMIAAAIANTSVKVIPY